MTGIGIRETEMSNSPASAKAFSKPKTNGADNFGLPTAVPFSTDSSNLKASSNLCALPKPFINLNKIQSSLNRTYN